ncbi:MAG: lytic transglycosylase domain-containing protein [Paracoccaceae bacterium]
MALCRSIARLAAAVLWGAAFWTAACAAASAFTLEEARRHGALVAEALAAGGAGRWDAAMAVAATAGDPLVRDIVLWRKLRAGAGTVAEYQGFAARRGAWPGQEPLRRAVFGERPSSPARQALTGGAARAWAAFSDLWSRRDYDAAALYLDGLSTSAGALGDPGVWADRRARLARRETREGRHRRAYRLAANAFTDADDGYDHADLQWIAGWVALRRLGEPAAALRHFEAFLPLVDSPISLGRGHYWVGRAHEATGRVPQAVAAYARAARHQTSFYGQLAAAKIDAPGDRGLAETGLPDWRGAADRADGMARMAAIVHYAGEHALAWQVFRHLGETIDDPATLGAVADLALAMGAPHYAVRLAKQAAYARIVLPAAYYPVVDLATYVDRVEPALAMSLARQETELNPRAVSHAGARGLMQLMPATARKVAGWIGEDYDRGRLLSDWRYNARLGQTYLARRIAEYDGSYALAAAAYNAGKGRVDQWLAAYGDPRTGAVDVVDWIESIPFSETRNYVQRVMEGIWVYRTRLSGRAGPMTIEHDLARGVQG